MSQPQISIITVTYNSRDFIEECLVSLQKQQVDNTFEIVVVDNGSSDGTAAYIEKTFPEIILIKSDNKGFGAGNNLGAKAARGEFLAFVNPDTKAEVNWLCELVEPLRQGGKVTTSKVLLIDDPERVNTCGNTLHFCGYAFVNGFKDLAEDFPKTQPVSGLSGAAFGMKKEDFWNIGGFDEKIFLYCEDTELSWRCRRYGYEIILAVNSVVYHQYHLELNPKKVYYLEFGRWSLIKKHLSWSQWLFLFPSIILADLLSWSYAMKFGFKGLAEKCKAIFQALQQPSTKMPLPNPPHKMNLENILKIPFELVSKNKLVCGLGYAVNLFFVLNYRVYSLICRPSKKATK